MAVEADKIVICNNYVKETWSDVDDAIEMSEEAPVGVAVRDGHSIGGGVSRRPSSEMFFSFRAVAARKSFTIVLILISTRANAQFMDLLTTEYRLMTIPGLKGCRCQPRQRKFTLLLQASLNLMERWSVIDHFALPQMCKGRMRHFYFLQKRRGYCPPKSGMCISDRAQQLHLARSNNELR